MDSILSALLRDPVINRLTSKQSPARGAALPETLVARVVSLKGETAVLRYQGGTFNAALDANVSAGETLLLKYNGSIKGRSHYKILSRIPAAINSGELSSREAAEPMHFGLMPSSAGTKCAAPALVRFQPERGSATGSAGPAEPFLELFVDTDSFGLILVSFYYHKDDRLECRFVVETAEAGFALQEEALRIVNEAGGHEHKMRSETLKITVGNPQKAAAEAIYSGGRGLNVKA